MTCYDRLSSSCSVVSCQKQIQLKAYRFPSILESLLHQQDASINSNEDWSVSLEGTLLLSKRSYDLLSDLRETERFLSPLSNLRSLNFRVMENNSLDDMNTLMSSRMTTRKLRVHLRDSSTKSSISIFLVHVNIILSSKVLKNDTIVLYRVSVLFKDFTN